MKKARQTTVGVIGADTLAYTAGEDVRLDLNLVWADCLGSAAHVTMLSRMPVRPRLFTEGQRKRVIAELVKIARQGAAGAFKITVDDQDVHLAVERTLTAAIGDLGKRIHTGRSRNDQVALDFRLFAKRELLGSISEAAALARTLLAFGKAHRRIPMVGRTHMQPAMPSSVALWASAFSEELLDDIALLVNAYELNDRSPLGSAAGYGVPLPIDRQLVSDLLGFAAPCHNVLYAGNARGKIESIVLHAMAQTMLTLSRLAQDLILFTMPEFNYFRLPSEFCTGSSIMPQKRNPDVLELMRAKSVRVQSAAAATMSLIQSLPTGYNRDLQEAKGWFMDGIATTRASLRIANDLVAGTKVNEEALRAGFTPDVFATDRAIELVGQGMPFRDAYHHVKAHLDELKAASSDEAIAKKRHLGGTHGLDFALLEGRIRKADGFAATRLSAFRRAAAKLMGASDIV